MATDKKERKPLLAPVERTKPEQVVATLTPRAFFMWLNSMARDRTFEPVERNWNPLAYYLRNRNVEFPQVHAQTISYMPEGSAPLPLWCIDYMEVMGELATIYEQITVDQALGALARVAPECADPIVNMPEAA